MDLVTHAGNSRTAIPVDLIVEILSLLPAKSIIQFQSVSKQWFSIIRSKDLVNTFLTRSKTRPYLLLVLELFTPRRHFVYTVPEHKICEKTSTAISKHYMSHLTCVYYFTSRPVNGFVCFTGTVSSNSITVYNPITRQTVKLPDVRNNGRKVYKLLGYDPVEDQYKVLCVIMYARHDKQEEHFVCTVSSTQKQEWRKIERTPVVNYYCYIHQGICINGSIYFGIGELNIVRFDVRSEKMDLIKAPEESYFSTTCYSSLINYSGRLGGVEFCYYEKEIILWILEDVEKQEWSRNTFKYPCEWKGFRFQLQSEGLIDTGELMVFQRSLMEAKPLCVYYYDFNKESARKADIDGVETDLEYFPMLYCYVENIRFL